MKNFLMITGLLTSMSFSVGIVFKLMHWSGANVLMAGGLLLFCILFAPLWLYTRFKKSPQLTIDKTRWGLGLLAGVSFAIGNAFKIMHWPGANVLLLLGGFVFAFAFLPLIFFRMYGDKQFG